MNGMKQRPTKEEFMWHLNDLGVPTVQRIIAPNGKNPHGIRDYGCWLRKNNHPEFIRQYAEWLPAPAEAAR